MGVYTDALAQTARTNIFSNYRCILHGLGLKSEAEVATRTRVVPIKHGKRKMKSIKQLKYMKNEKNENIEKEQTMKKRERDTSGTSAGQRSSSRRSSSCRTRILNHTPPTASHARHGTRFPSLSVPFSQPPIWAEYTSFFELFF